MVAVIHEVARPEATEALEQHAIDTMAADLLDAGVDLNDHDACIAALHTKQHPARHIGWLIDEAIAQARALQAR